MSLTRSGISKAVKTRGKLSNMERTYYLGTNGIDQAVNTFWYTDVIVQSYSAKIQVP